MIVTIQDSEIKNFPTAHSWRNAYKLLQNILKSIKFLGIFISKILSSFFVKNNESRVFMKRFRREKVAEKAEAKRKENHKTEGK